MQGRVLIKVRGVIRGITRHGVQSILIFQMIQGSSVFKETNEKCGSLETTKNNWLKVSVFICQYKMWSLHLSFWLGCNDLHRQIKSIHRTIGIRILTIYFSLEGRQACPKTSGSKEIKGKRRKARFFLTRLVTYYLFDNELAIRAFMFGLHWTPEPWLSEYMQFKTNHSRKRKNITSRK